MNLKYTALLSIFLLVTVLVVHAKSNTKNYSTSKHNLVGKQAPHFVRTALFPDGTVKDLDLHDYQGKKVVLYFYPMDKTPGCSKQARLFRDGMAKLQAQGIEVIGVSCDSIASHRAFAQENNLNYPLVSDARFRRPVSEKYNASGFLSSKRKTFLINQGGIIFKQFDDVDIAHQIDDILAAFAIDSK